MYYEPTLLVDCAGYATWKLDETAGGACRFQGKFQEANAKNKNMRVYPEHVLKTNVEKLKEAIEHRGLFGELDHPTDSIIHLTNASHIITRLWWEGNVLMGEGEILNTPSGRVLKAITEAGVRWGISSRGVGQGQVNNEGVLVIGDSYKLITFDAVADPSTYSAFQKKKAGRNESSEYSPVVTPAGLTRSFEGPVKENNTKALISFFGCKLNEGVEAAKARFKK